MAAVPSRRRRSLDAGFTLIELIVAMVLLAIVMALVGTAVISALTSATGARNGAISDAALARATGMFEDDIAAAVTADREASLVRDVVKLSDILQDNVAATSDDPASGGGTLDYDEVRLATPSEIQVIQDASPVAGLECITWRAVSSGGELQVQRLVAPAAGCGSGSISTQTYLRASLALPGIDTTPFSFELVCNRSQCPPTGAPSGPDCAAWTVADAAVPASRRRWVVGMRMQVQAMAADGGTATRSRGGAFVAIRSRDTDSYRRALGC